MSSEPISASPATLSEMLTTLRRGWRWIGGITLAALFLAALWMALSKPLFRARATILLEQDTPSGLLGELAMLASIASATSATSEIVVLESRTLAEATLSPALEESGSWNPDDPRRLGLATRVSDPDLSPVRLLARFLFDRPPPEVPLVLPEKELQAWIARLDPEAPEELRVEFLAKDRVRIQTSGTRRVRAGSCLQPTRAPIGSKHRRLRPRLRSLEAWCRTRRPKGRSRRNGGTEDRGGFLGGASACAARCTPDS